MNELEGEGVEESARETRMPGVAREAPASEAMGEVAEELVVSRCEGRVAEVVGRRTAEPKPERVEEVAGSFVAVVPCKRRDHLQVDTRYPLDEGQRARVVPRRPLLCAKKSKKLHSLLRTCLSQKEIRVSSSIRNSRHAPPTLNSANYRNSLFFVGRCKKESLREKGTWVSTMSATNYRHLRRGGDGFLCCERAKRAEAELWL